MLFPAPNFVNFVWNKVARATNAGELGVSAKVATNGNPEGSQPVCIYTYDFADMADVKRGMYSQISVLGATLWGADHELLY